MATRNYIRDYIKYFSTQTGGAPRQEKLEWAIRETLTETDLRLFFMLPFQGADGAGRAEEEGAQGRACGGGLRRKPEASA